MRPDDCQSIIHEDVQSESDKFLEHSWAEVAQMSKIQSGPDVEDACGDQKVAGGVWFCVCACVHVRVCECVCVCVRVRVRVRVRVHARVCVLCTWVRCTCLLAVNSICTPHRVCSKPSSTRWTHQHCTPQLMQCDSTVAWPAIAVASARRWTCTTWFSTKSKTCTSTRPRPLPSLTPSLTLASKLLSMLPRCPHRLLDASLVPTPKLTTPRQPPHPAAEAFTKQAPKLADLVVVTRRTNGCSTNSS